MPCYLFYHLFYISAPLQFAPLFPVFLHLRFHPQHLLQLVLSLWIGLGQYSLLIPQSFLPRGSLSPLTRRKVVITALTRHDEKILRSSLIPLYVIFYFCKILTTKSACLCLSCKIRLKASLLSFRAWGTDKSSLKSRFLRGKLKLIPDESTSGS